MRTFRMHGEDAQQLYLIGNNKKGVNMHPFLYCRIKGPESRKYSSTTYHAKWPFHNCNHSWQHWLNAPKFNEIHWELLKTTILEWMKTEIKFPHTNLESYDFRILTSTGYILKGLIIFDYLRQRLVHFQHQYPLFWDLFVILIFGIQFVLRTSMAAWLWIEMKICVSLQGHSLQPKRLGSTFVSLENAR